MNAETPNPFLHKDDTGIYTITPQGKEYLQAILTDAEGDVYSTTHEADPLMIAAGMARLSRRGDDMRITLLDEFAHPGIVCYSTIPGIRYDQVEERADQFVLGGTRVPVMAIADLITLRSEGPLANDEDHAVLQQLQDLTRREPS